MAMMWKLNTSVLGKAFFWFGLIMGVFAVFTQYGFVYQVGTQSLFAEPTFYLLIGILSMLGGIFLNTEKTNSLL